jgi:uncharacterized protein YyaL (SSP411 family)
MRYILFILSILFISPLFAQNVLWEKDLDKAFDKSINSNKPMLVYLTMDNCIYCNQMRDITWKDARILRLMKNFIPLKLKYEEQPDKVKIFNPRGFPTTFIIKPRTQDGRKFLDVKYSSPGFIPATKLQEALESNK